MFLNSNEGDSVPKQAPAVGTGGIQASGNLLAAGAEGLPECAPCVAALLCPLLELRNRGANLPHAGRARTPASCGERLQACCPDPQSHPPPDLREEAEARLVNSGNDVSVSVCPLASLRSCPHAAHGREERDMRRFRRTIGFTLIELLV